MLISSFITSKPDYCNMALVGLMRCDLDQLQSVINAAARLTVGAQHYNHITPLLVELHWLWMAERIQYKLCVLVYRCLHGSAPCYLQQRVCPVASMESRRRLRSVTLSDLMVPATKVNTGWPCLCCSRITGLEQPSGCYPSLSIIGNFQTFTQVPPLSAVFWLTLSFLVFVWQLWLRTAPLKWLCIIYGTLQIDYFTLHYICSRPYDLDLLTLKVSKSRVTWATSVPILVFVGLSVLELGPMYATDRCQTDKQTSDSIIA